MAMHLIQLNYPGSWLDYSDKTEAFRMQSAFSTLETELVKAALALHHFDVEFGRDRRSSLLSTTERDEERTQRAAVEHRIVVARGGDADDARFDESIRLEVDAELQRERFGLGILPRTYLHQAIFLYARAFLVSADLVVKLLAVLARSAIAPTGFTELMDDVERKFPRLRDARNSSAHLEDRARGLGLGQKVLNVKPYAGSGISSEGGGVLLENLENRFFGSTLASGDHGGVEVSAVSLLALQDAVQRAINLFKWHGFQSIAPA
jgi:hypothetical protein